MRVVMCFIGKASYKNIAFGFPCELNAFNRCIVFYGSSRKLSLCPIQMQEAAKPHVSDVGTLYPEGQMSGTLY